MRRVGVAVACLLMGVAGCSESRPAPAASPSASRAEVLRQALRDPQNVDVNAWSAVSVRDVDGGARAVCSDLQASSVPVATVWRHVIDRFGVSMTDADYFTRASAKVYCPGQQREAGVL